MNHSIYIFYFSIIPAAYIILSLRVDALVLFTWGVIQVKARAVGALHNVSSDVDSIRIIRRRGGIKWLIRLLHHSQPCVCGSAAGALQNVSREVASRLLIRDSDAVKCLIKLLQSTEVQTQVSWVHESLLGPKPNFLTKHYRTQT